MALLAPTLTPAQQEVSDALRHGDRPTFEPGLGAQLRDELEQGLADVVGPIDALSLAPVWISKHALSSVHGCEQRYLAEEAAGFEGWTTPMARGTVAHRAIELSMHVRGEPVPGELVDHALSRLAQDDNGLGQFLQSLNELDRADLRGQAVDHVCAFLELWPPLQQRWRPRSESRVRVELCGDRITLQGKVDLAVGYAEGTTAGKVLVDFKTGAFNPDHLHDLRFYALVEAIARGVPPRRVATHYLESGRLIAEDVSEPMLRTAARRVVDAVRRAVELKGGAGAPPVTKPSAVCRWCPVVGTCEPGQAHLAQAADW
jgi:CRISPR/Cas system-associated exonuclease Cas4 (RecB family)